MNFGEKFPYALLTFSQKFVEAGYWPHLFHARTPSPKSCRSWLLGYTTPQSLPARPAPHQPHTPHTHTPYTHINYTPTIHNPTTPPIPLLLRVDSDEMRQNRKVFAHEVLEYSQRAPYGAKSPRSGLRACAGANEGG